MAAGAGVVRNGDDDEDEEYGAVTRGEDDNGPREDLAAPVQVEGLCHKG